MNKHGTTSIRTAAIRAATITATTLLAVSISVQAGTLDLQQRHEFKIPSESLDAALTAFAAQTRIHVVTAGVSAGVLSRGVKGELSALDALRALLRGTGLSFRQANAETIAVVPTQTAQLRPTQFQLVQEVDQDALADQPAAAAPAGASELTEVSVTASRIAIAGYDAPTPVTIVGLPTLESDARTDIAQEMRDMPEFGPSPGPDNTGRATYISDDSAGLDQLQLRNLGAVRTLVLFNGQRVVNSNLANPGADISTIPTSLVERVDTVTGGASAAWGSDAVAGVVNFIINTKFDGLKVNLEAGNNWNDQMSDQKAEISYGTGFADNRGHIIVSGSFENSPDTFFGPEIEGDQFQRLVSNPAYAPGNGQPVEIHASYVGLYQATPGGIITGGPLNGTYFVGPGATPEAFNYGNVSSGFYTNGGTANYSLSQADFGEITNPFARQTFFAYASYDLTDNITASIQLNSGHFHALGNSWTATQYGSLTIESDNPFIPAPTLAQMQTLGITSFPLGTSLTGDMSNGESVAAEASSVGMPVVSIARTLNRGVFTLDGKMTVFGKPWTWTAYYQVAEVKTFSDAINNPQTNPIIYAANAVTVGGYNAADGYTAAAYPNPLGIPNGTVTCLSNLLPKRASGETTNCAPLNVFGYGFAQPEAAAYINGVARSGGDDSTQIIKQDVVSASTSGELPIGLPAGNISTAFGGEYRRDFGYISSTPAAIAQTFYVTGNTLPFYGADDVEEGFLEFNAPILKNQGVQSLNIDVAGRETDYAVSGSVQTYKIGAVSQLIDLIRLRGSYSRDIRAPWLWDLFNKGQSFGATATDPHTGLGVEVFDIDEGNTKLKPEIGNTTTLGVVLTPLPSLELSVDWWRIGIRDVITSTSAQEIDALCIAGQQAYCNDLVYGGPNGALSEVLVEPVNASIQWESGFDMAADYHTPFLAGTLSLHYTGTYMYQDMQNLLGMTYNAAGSIGEGLFTGVPRFKGVVAATYNQDIWTVTAQSRIIGSAKLNNGWVVPSGGNPWVDDNDIAAVYYLDLRGSVQIHKNFQLYAAVDNALDKRPPPVVLDYYGTGSGYYAPFTDQIYDVFGRVWRAGVRLSL